MKIQSINKEQLSSECGIDLIEYSIISSKGEMWFEKGGGEKLSESDLIKIENALKNHIPQPKEPTGFNTTQLAQIRQIIQEELVK